MKMADYKNMESNNFKKLSSLRHFRKTIKLIKEERMKELEKTVFWAGINLCKALHDNNKDDKKIFISDKNSEQLSRQNDQEALKVEFEKYITSLPEGEKIKAEIIKNKYFNSNNKYHIFISHSHADKNLALTLRDILKNEFNFTSFIDSELWADISRLEEYIIINYKQWNRYLFDYDIARELHKALDIILSTSLHQALLNSKFFVFIKTDNSMKLDRMHSPWLYFENQIAKNIFYKKPKKRLNLESINESHIAQFITFDYGPNSDNFDKISGIRDLIEYFRELGY